MFSINSDSLQQQKNFYYLLLFLGFLKKKMLVVILQIKTFEQYIKVQQTHLLPAGLFCTDCVLPPLSRGCITAAALWLHLIPLSLRTSMVTWKLNATVSKRDLPLDCNVQAPHYTYGTHTHTRIGHTQKHVLRMASASTSHHTVPQDICAHVS